MAVISQPIKALEKANHIRMYRSQLKRELRAGRLDIKEMLIDPPEEVVEATAYTMIMAIPWIGRVRALYALRQAGCSEYTKIGELGRRRLDILLRELP